MTAHDSVVILRAFLESALDVADEDVKRFKSRQVQECIQQSHTLINELMRDLIVDPDCVDDASVKREILFSLALGLQKGWFIVDDIDHTVISELVFAVVDSSSATLPITTRAESSWALGILASRGFTVPTPMKLKRMVAESELLQFDVTSNFSTVDSAPKRDFPILIQFQSGFKNLGLAELSVAGRVDEILTLVSRKPEFANAIIASHFIWWLARSESPVHPLMNEWAKICINRADSLSENERWMASAGLAHVLDIAKRRGDTITATLSQNDYNQLEFCVQKKILNRPKRASVSWRKGGQKHFI